MTKIRTALVGSYVQPEWLIDREALRNRLPARIMTGDMWRVAPELLHEAMDDAVLSILEDQASTSLHGEREILETRTAIYSHCARPGITPIQVARCDLVRSWTKPVE